MKKQITLARSIFEISQNPFYMLELIIATLCGYDKRDVYLLEIYLILPLLLYETSFNVLSETNSRGNLYRLYLDKNRKAIGGLEKRIKKLKNLTNEAILIGISRGWLDINEDNLYVELNCKKRNEFEKRIKEKKGIYKVAKNLGRILSKLDYKENYRLLGVKNI